MFFTITHTFWSYFQLCLSSQRSPNASRLSYRRGAAATAPPSTVACSEEPNGFSWRAGRSSRYSGDSARCLKADRTWVCFWTFSCNLWTAFTRETLLLNFKYWDFTLNKSLKVLLLFRAVRNVLRFKNQPEEPFDSAPSCFRCSRF